MKLHLKNIKFPTSIASLTALPSGKLLINTINAHSYNTAQEDTEFAKVLLSSDVLLPDGVSVVWAVRFLNGVKIQKIAGEDLFFLEMKRLNKKPPSPLQIKKIGINCGVKERMSVLFLGSSESTLAKIKDRAGVEFPNVEVHTFSPPYKPEFSDEDNSAMIAAINTVQPDVLFVGMTAPKQEKWAWKMINDKRLVINDCHICCIGAVFDFYAGTVNRAPKWIINLGLEWLYRLVKEPKRMWRRYLIGNVKFVGYVLREKFENLKMRR
ncbi:MAG: WecB/TagA/CpsF family glycosyltransferase [Bacteroidia bacterium]